MDIHGIGQKNIEEIKADTLWLTSTKEEKQSGSLIEDLIPAGDSSSTSQLEQLKAQVKNAQEPGAATRLEKIKEAVANGTFDVPSDILADRLMEDGFIDFLID